MDNQTYEKLEGLLVKAVQSGKKETSDLVGDIKDEILTLKIYHTEVIERLVRIEIQTKITNGSVMSLKLWRSLMIGGMGMITLIVFPLLIYIFYENTIRVQAQIDKSMDLIGANKDKINDIKVDKLK